MSNPEAKAAFEASMLCPHCNQSCARTMAEEMLDWTVAHVRIPVVATVPVYNCDKCNERFTGVDGELARTDATLQAVAKTFGGYMEADDKHSASRRLPQGKPVFIAWTNTDLTEGRGHQVPLVVCESETAAIRLGLNKYVMGTNCPVSAFEAISSDGGWCAPVRIIPASKEDLAADAALKAKRAAIARAVELGMTPQEIEALGVRS